MSDMIREVLSNAKLIKAELALFSKPPDDGFRADSEHVIPFAITRDTRGYIEKVVNQINGSYEKGWYDCCAVMIRRIIETVIIEAFEKHAIQHKIKDQNGDYFFLSDLIPATLNESSWSLGRNTKKALPHLKHVGDRSAHSRRFTATRNDIEKLTDDLRITIQEFIYLAGLK